MNPNRVLEELARHQLVDGYPMVVDLERSEGVWIHDAASGNRYMDAFTCFASMPLGFNHPGMNDSGFLDTLRRAALCNVSNADIYSCEMADFVDTFATYASPEGFNHHFWIAGGGLAVENAMKAAFDWKARRLGRTDFEDNCDDLKIMHFRQAFHGRTGYTMSVTNTIPDKVGLFPKFPWPRIHNPACQFDLDGNICNDVEAEEAKACEQIEAAFGDRCTSTAAGRFFTQLFAAAGGAACAGSVRIPQEVVKQGCMAEMYPNAINAVQTISQEKGVAGFYKGAVATISRDVAWNSLSFALFRVFLEAFAVQSAQLNYALGIVAGCLAACATHPIDVIKTRIMTSSGDAASVGIVEGLRNLVDEEGPGVLLSGLVPRLLYLGPLASLVLATNEVIASILIAGRK